MLILALRFAKAAGLFFVAFVAMAAKQQWSKAVSFIEHIQLRTHCGRN